METVHARMEASHEDLQAEIKELKERQCHYEWAIFSLMTHGVDGGKDDVAPRSGGCCGLSSYGGLDEGGG